MKTLTAISLIMAMLQNGIFFDYTGIYKQVETAFKYAKIEFNDAMKVNDISISRDESSDSGEVFLSLTIDKKEFKNNNDFPKEKFNIEELRGFPKYSHLVTAAEKRGWDIAVDDIIYSKKFTQRTKTIYDSKIEENITISLPYTVDFLIKDKKESDDVEIIVTYQYPLMELLIEEYIEEWSKDLGKDNHGTYSSDIPT